MPILKVTSLAKETDHAVSVLDSNDKVVWLPKSQIKVLKKRDCVEIDVPGWLAAKADTLEYEED